jgi:hypothetical protein
MDQGVEQSSLPNRVPKNHEVDESEGVHVRDLGQLHALLASSFMDCGGVGMGLPRSSTIRTLSSNEEEKKPAIDSCCTGLSEVDEGR